MRAQSLDPRLDELVALHRTVLVLLDEASANGDGDSLERTARLVYARKQELITEIQRGIERSEISLDALRDYVSALPPGDRLAFDDLLDDVDAIESARARFGDEVRASRGGAPREAWEDYLESAKVSVDVQTVLREFPLTPAPGRRGAKPYGEHALFGYELPKKHVVLTFDDGPHPRHTESILDTLQTYGASAYFFAVGRNLGSIEEENDTAQWTRASVRARLAHEAGHFLANHSYSHRQMPKLDEGERRRELNETNQLLQAIIGRPPTLFRPPYGETDRTLTEEYARAGMTSVLWNVDSWDWGDPVPESIAERVIERVEKAERGILLFHDVHKQTALALPLILKELTLRGYRFSTLDGREVGSPRPVTSLDASRADPSDEGGMPKEHEAPYRESWALIVGINTYEEWPQLRYAVNDAAAIEAALKESFGFPDENVMTLIDGEATRDRIVETLSETLADPSRVDREDRVFIFFAGHGATRKLPSGGELGYIVPVDAGLGNYPVRSISMSQLQDFSALIPAKHVYFVMDSCYSGIALTRGGGATDPYFQEITRRTARQILTAGGADQAVADGGPGGHSIFTWTLLQGLQGLADLDGNGLLTATELGAFTAPIVSKFSSQTPAFGNLEGSEGGEFVLELKLESLSAASQQLDAEALAMNVELERLQAELSVKLERNLALHHELVESRNADERRIAQANRHHALGLQYFREKRYQRAREELENAVALNPANPTIVNNYGFLLYRMGRVQESLPWFEKTMALDPERAVVYVNVADALRDVGRREEAASHYRRYLALWPDSPLREVVEAALAAVESGAARR